MVLQYFKALPHKAAGRAILDVPPGVRPFVQINDIVMLPVRKLQVAERAPSLQIGEPAILQDLDRKALRICEQHKMHQCDVGDFLAANHPPDGLFGDHHLDGQGVVGVIAC